jgi:hypothetical protein
MKSYYGKVHSTLEKATTREAVIDTLNTIAKKLMEGTF